MGTKNAESFFIWAMTLPVENVRLSAPQLRPRLMAASRRSPPYTYVHALNPLKIHKQVISGDRQLNTKFTVYIIYLRTKCNSTQLIVTIPKTLSTAY